MAGGLISPLWGDTWEGVRSRARFSRIWLDNDSFLGDHPAYRSSGVAWNTTRATWSAALYLDGVLIGRKNTPCFFQAVAACESWALRGDSDVSRF